MLLATAEISNRIGIDSGARLKSPEQSARRCIEGIEVTFIAGAIRALNSATGELKWEFPLHSAPRQELGQTRRR